MFDIYIKNYYTRAGEYITDETLMYSIPMESDEDDSLIDPKVQVEMGKAGSFEFAMYIGHPYYEAIRQMKTIFRIVYDGDTIFRGRVLTIDTGHMTGNKKIHCEGDLAFLIDSQMEGVPDANRTKTNALTYIQSLLANHNSQMANDMPDKQFALGQVPGTYTSSITEPQQVNPENNYRYGSASWKDSQSAFVELSDSFGGYWRTRYQNGTAYLDWLDNYYYSEINPQTIEIGQNMIDISSSSEVNNIFTALIPVGSSKSKKLYINDYRTDIHGNTNYILVPQILSVFADEQLNSGFHSKQDYANAVRDYGLIFRTESFENADTKEKLWQYATDWIKNNYCGGLSSFTIGAIDMHLVGQSAGKFLIGGRVNVIYPDVDNRDTDPEAMIHKVMTVMKATYDLHHPEKNQYTIGIPNAILKKNYGEKSKSGGGGKTVGKNKDQEGRNGDFSKRFEYGDSLIWSFVCDSEHNKQVFEDYAATHGDKQTAAIQRAAYIMVSRAVQSPDPEERKYAESIILDGENNALIMKGRKFHSDEVDEFNKTLSSILINGNQNAIEIKQDEASIPSDPVWDLDKRPTVMQLKADGGSSSFKFFRVFDQRPEDIGEALLTTVTDGFKGAVTTNGIDVAGALEDVEKVADGDMLGAIGLKDKKITTSADGETVNTEIDGSEDGKMTVGKDQNDDWLITINDKVTYRDASGTTHTLEPGFVTANDLKLAGENPIASFKTKLAIMDTAIIGKASIGDLEAVNARIDKITASTVDADTRVSAGWGNFTNLTAQNANVVNTLTVGSLDIRDQQGHSSYPLTSGISSIGEATSSDGVITIPYVYYNGTSSENKTINFNIADTQFYKDGVSAAKASVKITSATRTRESNEAISGDSSIGTAGYKYILITASADNGATRTISVNATPTYTAGETAGEAKFEQATVTKQGAAETVYVEDNTNGTNYYTAGTAVSYRQAGTKMSKVTMYGSGGTVTPISTKHNRTYYGALYSSGAAGATPVGYGAWYLWQKDTKDPLYEAASSSVYRRGTKNDNCYVEDPNGAYLMAGSSVTVTPINNSSKITIKSDTRYAEGTEDTTTYYTKKATQTGGNDGPQPS